MQISYQIWCVALLCLLGCQISATPTDTQSDDWGASTLIEYVRPYKGALVEKVTNSTIWSVFGSTMDRVTDAISLSREYMHTYYEDHLKEPKENTMEWIKQKKETVVGMVQKYFE